MMKQKYKFLLKHVPNNIEILNSITSSKINEIRISIIRCHRTVILSRLLFEEDKGIYGDYIPNASKLPSFVYNPKEIVPPRISPQLLQQTAYLFSFLHSNLDTLFEGMLRLINKKDLSTINETNFHKINSPTFHFLISSALPALFGFFSSKEYVSLAFSFYSQAIGLNSPFLTFKIIYPFCTAPWIFRYFESSLIPFFKSFSRDTRVQQYFVVDSFFKKKQKNRQNDILFLSKIYSEKLIDAFISNALLLPQFFIAMIKMLGEKWKREIVGGFLANELFKDMSFKFLNNFGYNEYREFLEKVFDIINGRIDLQVKLSMGFCSINISSFSSLEMPEIFTAFGHKYLNFLVSVPEILALEKAYTAVKQLPSSITGFLYTATPKFYLFLFKIFPKRNMMEPQKERSLIFRIEDVEVPERVEFERRFLEINMALVNKQQDLIQSLRKMQKESDASEVYKNESTKHNSNENANKNENLNANSNSNENKNLHENLNANENGKSSSIEKENLISNSALCESDPDVDDDLSSEENVYAFCKVLHYEKPFLDYTLSRCVNELNEQARAFEGFMVSSFNLSRLRDWLNIALEQECVMMRPVANLAVRQAFLRNYESVQVAFDHASTLFKRSSIIKKEQYLALVSLFMPQLVRRIDHVWRDEMQRASKSAASSGGIMALFSTKKHERHLSFEENRVRMFGTRSCSDENIKETNLSLDSSIRMSSKESNMSESTSKNISSSNDNKNISSTESSLINDSNANIESKLSESNLNISRNESSNLCENDKIKSNTESNSNNKNIENENIRSSNTSSSAKVTKLSSIISSVKIPSMTRKSSGSISITPNLLSSTSNSSRATSNITLSGSSSFAFSTSGSINLLPPPSLSNISSSQSSTSLFPSTESLSRIFGSTPSVTQELDSIENLWEMHISFISPQFGRIDTGIKNKYAGVIFFDAVESFRNVSVNNLSASFKNLTSAINLLVNLFESGMSKIDLIQMAIVLSDNKQLLRFYMIIKAFAMKANCFQRLCTDDEELSWVKFENTLLKMINMAQNNELKELFFRVQKKMFM